MCSDCYEVRSGVPQAIVLGPLLNLLFTADLPTTDYTTIATFADDTGLLEVHRDPAVASQRLQSHLTLLHNWFSLWKICQPGEVCTCYLHHRTRYLPSCISAHHPNPSQTRC